MASRRTLKAASAIREVVSMAILTGIRDPRVCDVTVIGVEVTGDMRTAKIHVSIMGDEKKQALCLHGLKRSAGFIQSRIKDRIDTRFIPKVEFKLDEGVKHSVEISRILQDVLPDSQDDEADADSLTAEGSDHENYDHEDLENEQESESPPKIDSDTSESTED
ncbi:MAG: ribosome-binding factor A [Blastopirellula sp.]|nr:MAG: ribosome-binding factor A [Blastopirellula sp.]